MDEKLQKLEADHRASPAYAQAVRLIEEREKLERQIQEIDRALEAHGVAGQLARIDRMRHSLLSNAQHFPLAG